MDADGDPFFLELLLNDVALVGLLDAARSLEGVNFLHGGKQETTNFRFAKVEPSLRGCIEWASTCDLGDAREAIGVQQLAALRAWTCTPLCYALCHVMRSPDRTLASVQPALSFCRLLFTAMRGIPKKYVFNDGILYRAERGVMRTWDAKMREGGIFSFYVPTSFSRDPAVVAKFKDEGSRTVFILRGAAGIILDQISPYDEKEVLLEPVCHCEVLLSEKFDASHRDVQMGEVKEGLHRVEGHVRPGIALLEGSQVKALEAASYRNWQQQQHMQQQRQHLVPELEFDPFSEEELSAMNKPVPRIKNIQRMSRLGGGAFATTYRKRVRIGAVNSDVSRFAVKVISVDRILDMNIEADDVRREATTLGMLRHKHVIRYFGLIETDEELALVMELAEGGSLADLITITKTSASGQGVQMGEVLEMTGQLGSALDYIHGQGIVHRDVKADNILLAHINGAGPLCVKLADFGMAAVLATGAGSNLLSKGGTLPYFAPERGKDKAYGAKADMWALGCVLIELVTLTRLQRGLWNDDTEVVERRNHLLGQVKLRDKAIGMLVEGLLEMDKSCRLSAIGLKAACSALVPAHTTSHERSSSGQVKLVGAFDVFFDLADLSRKLTETGVHDILGEIYDLWQQQDTAGDLEELEQLQQLHCCLGRHLAVLKKPPMDMRKTLVQLASQEPVGTRLVLEAEAALRGLQQEVIEWVNKPSAPLPCVMEICEHSEGVLSVAVSPDGKWIASGSLDNTVRVVERKTGRVKCTLTGHSNWVSSVSFSQDGKHVASGSYDNSVKIWETSTGTCVSTLSGHSDCVNSVAWSPNSTILASGSDDRTIKLWNTNTGDCVSTLTGHSREVSSVSFSPDGKQVASGSWDQCVKIWETSTGTCVSTLSGHKDSVLSVCFSPCGTKILSGGGWPKDRNGNGDFSLRIWDAETGTQIGSPLSGHSSNVSSVSFSPDGKQVASGSWDKTVKLWETSTGTCDSTLIGHSDWVRSVVWSPDGTKIASGSDDKTVKMWNAQTGQCVSTWAHSGPVQQVEFTHDGATLVSGGGDTIRYWDVQSGVAKEGKAGEEAKRVLEGSMFTFSKGSSREQKVGNFLITAEGDILRIFKSEGGVTDKADKDRAPVAFFRAPAPICTVDTSGEHIAVGCQNGEVLQLRAAVLLTG